MKSVILAAALLLAPMAASAQGWEVYDHPEDGFAFQLPAKPTLSKGTYAVLGQTAPANTYSLKDNEAELTLVVADFSKTKVEGEAAMAEVAKGWSARGKVTVEEQARINQNYGRHAGFDGRDGSHTQTSVFFVDRKLYVLEAKALGPRPDQGSAKTVHFQQSLEFIGSGR